jgi:hypothetical protein
MAAGCAAQYQKIVDYGTGLLLPALFVAAMSQMN